MSKPKKPKVIFLDAVGTLFGVKGSVGTVYSAIASDFGVEVDPKNLNSTFYRCFQESSPLAFPNVDILDLPEKEYYWWHEVVQKTFEEAGYLSKFDDFEAFFQQLYAYFMTADPWVVYPEVMNVLKKWRYPKKPESRSPAEAPIELGIISNFDSRLHGLLSALELDKFFTSITISSVVGVAKPNEKIFEIALSKHECDPQEAWHIGDSVKNDYKGAKAAGLRSFLLDRSRTK